MQGKKQQLEPDIEQGTGSKSGKEFIKAVYCYPAYLTYLHEKCWADESQAGIKIAGRNINNLRHADDIILMAESKEELTNLLRKVKKESEKAGLKLNIHKMKIMASGPSTSLANKWARNGNSGRFYFLGLQNHCGQ